MGVEPGEGLLETQAEGPVFLLAREGSRPPGHAFTRSHACDYTFTRLRLRVYTPARPSPVPSGQGVSPWGRPVAQSPNFRIRKTMLERRLCHFVPGRPGESPLTLEPHFLVCETGVRPAAPSLQGRWPDSREESYTCPLKCSINTGFGRRPDAALASHEAPAHHHLIAPPRLHRKAGPLGLAFCDSDHVRLAKNEDPLARLGQGG